MIVPTAQLLSTIDDPSSGSNAMLYVSPEPAMTASASSDASVLASGRSASLRRVSANTSIAVCFSP